MFRAATRGVALLLLLSACSDPKPTCGNAALDPGEACDDGATAAGDGCSPECSVEIGWSCTGQPSSCNPNCGDGRVLGNEPCDDANLRSGDGCSDVCAVESGFVCVPLGCLPTCGDGLLRGDERCDDGNVMDGDGCRPSCDVQTGWMCQGEPSSCALRCVAMSCGFLDCGEKDDGCGVTLDCGGCTGWSALPIRASPTARRNPFMLAAGDQVIVWSGFTPSGVVSDGARFDLNEGSWHALSMAGAQPPTSGGSAIWTGSEMIVWGGTEISSSTVTSRGWRYSLADDRWTPTSTIGAPSRRGNHSAVWTGQEMIVWGGQDGDSAKLGSGGRYNPLTDQWRPIASSSVAAAVFHSAVWSGQEMLVHSSSIDSVFVRYDPVADRWRLASQLADPIQGQMVWTGTVAFVFGNPRSDPSASAAAYYDPGRDCWTLTTRVGIPSHRLSFGLVSTPRGAIVWGGELRPFNDPLDTGATYNLATDTWLVIDTLRVPNPRSMFGAVWTGDRMMVWGGWAGGPLGDGALYVPDP